MQRKAQALIEFCPRQASKKTVRWKILKSILNNNPSVSISTDDWRNTCGIGRPVIATTRWVQMQAMTNRKISSSKTFTISRQAYEKTVYNTVSNCSFFGAKYQRRLKFLDKKYKNLPVCCALTWRRGIKHLKFPRFSSASKYAYVGKYTRAFA